MAATLNVFEGNPLLLSGDAATVQLETVFPAAISHWRADDTVLSPAPPPTTISQWNDMVGPWPMVQAIKAQQYLDNASNALLGGRESGDSDGVDDNYTATGSNAAFQGLHAGTPSGAIWWGLAHWRAPTAANLRILLTLSSAANVGCQLLWNLNGSLRLAIANGSGAFIANQTSAAGVLPFNTTASVAFAAQRFRVPEWEVYVDGVSIMSGIFTGIPSSAPSTLPLRITPFISAKAIQLDLADHAVIGNALPSTIATLESYRADRYGV
jgi:hypothetical protein